MQKERIGAISGTQNELLETGMDHDEPFEDTLMNNKNEWLDFVKKMFCVLVLAMLDIIEESENIQDLERKRI